TFALQGGEDFRLARRRGGEDQGHPASFRWAHKAHPVPFGNPLQVTESIEILREKGTGRACRATGAFEPSSGAVGRLGIGGRTGVILQSKPQTRACRKGVFARRGDVVRHPPPIPTRPLGAKSPYPAPIEGEGARR